MANLTENEIIDKWVHLAQKIFPPQTVITPASNADGPLITVRWKDERNPDVLSKRARGVDLFFPAKVLESYKEGDAALELKWDALIEGLIAGKLARFDPYIGVATQPERWIISDDPPAR
jgi:hypothetical protein